MTRADRAGFALLLCLLLALALSLLAAGMLILADRETRIASAAVRLVQARARAEGAARRAFGGWSTAALADLPVGGRRVLADAPDVAVEAERVDDGLFLLRSESRAAAPGSPGARVATGLLVRTAGATVLTGGARAAVVVADGAVVEGGTVSGLDACAGEHLPGVGGPDVEIGAGAVVEGLPPTIPDSAAPDLLEGFPVAGVAAITLPSGTGTPVPAIVDGTCDPGDWNWGSAASGSPCADHRPLVHALGDLVIQGGEGQGVLVVDGNLTVSDGFSFRGVVVVRGRLRVEGAVIAGSVRARHLDMTDGSLRFDSCALAAAARGPAFDRAFRPPGRWWIPLF